MPSGRDQVLVPQPSFQVGARFEPGMSGGPVFDEAGLVIGVVSSGMSDGARPYGTASLIAPILPLQLEGPYFRGSSLLAQMQEGRVPCEGTSTQMLFRRGEQTMVSWAPSDVRPTNKLGRNEPCFCGSTLKYKRCHGT